MTQNITNIPAPRVAFMDERTGLMSREWYRFFLNLFIITGAGASDVSVVDLLQAPNVFDVSGDFSGNLVEAQLLSAMSRYEQAMDDLSMEPRAEVLQAELDLNPRLEIGTLAAQNASNVAITGGTLSGITISTTGGAVLASTSAALTNGAGVGAGTLLTAPVAGNPTKWIGINDNGTTRYVPSW